MTTHQYIDVEQYNENDDTFVCSTSEVSGARDGASILFVVPGVVLPVLIREYGSPDELVGRTFAVAVP